MAVRNGVESWHLSINWQQQGDRYVIQLAGPMGSGQVQLRGDGRGVVLDDGENAPLSSSEPEALLYESTGLQIPVSGLRYWIRGLPDPRLTNGAPALENGRLKLLEQGGWRLRFRGYQQVNDMFLPQKLFMQRKDKELDVRLVIDQWQLGLPVS